MSRAWLLVAAAVAGAASGGPCDVPDYYTSVAALLPCASGVHGSALQNALHDLIDGHTVFPYTGVGTDVWDILDVADAYLGDPSTNQVLLVYKNVPARAIDKSNVNLTDGWNREHVWPQSYQVGASGADTSDCHSLRAADSNVNSARSNLYFDDCFDPGCTSPAHVEAASDTAKDSDRFMPPASQRGNLARSVFYMAARYDGSDSNTVDLRVTNCPSDTLGLFGKIDTLLAWHIADPPDAEEIRRNDVVCGFQGNRNPFIDFPKLALRIYDDSWTDPQLGCPGVTGTLAGLGGCIVTAAPSDSPTPPVPSTSPTMPTPAPVAVPTTPTTPTNAAPAASATGDAPGPAGTLTGGIAAGFGGVLGVAALGVACVAIYRRVNGSGGSRLQQNSRLAAPSY